MSFEKSAALTLFAALGMGQLAGGQNTRPETSAKLDQPIQGITTILPQANGSYSGELRVIRRHKSPNKEEKLDSYDLQVHAVNRDERLDHGPLSIWFNSETGDAYAAYHHIGASVDWVNEVDMKTLHNLPAKVVKTEIINDVRSTCYALSGDIWKQTKEDRELQNKIDTERTKLTQRPHDNPSRLAQLQHEQAEKQRYFAGTVCTADEPAIRGTIMSVSAITTKGTPIPANPKDQLGDDWQRLSIVLSPRIGPQDPKQFLHPKHFGWSSGSKPDAP